MPYMNKHNRHDLFEGMKAPVDAEKLWSEMSRRPDFPTKRRFNRRNLFLFLFLFLGFTAGASLVYYSQMKEHTEAQHETQSGDQQLSGEINSRKNLNSSIKKEVNNNENKLAFNAIDKNNEVSGSAFNSEERAENNTGIVSESTDRTDETTDLIMQGKPATDVSYKVVDGKEVKMYALEPLDKNKNTKINKEQISDQIKTNNSEQNNIQVFEDKTINKTSNDAVQFNNAVSTTATSNTTSDKTNFSVLSPLAMLDLNLNITASYDQANLPLVAQTEIKPYKQVRAKKWSIGLTPKIGSDLWNIENQNRTPQLSAVDLSYSNREVESESLLSHGIGLDVRRNFGDWYAQLGVAYQESGQRLYFIERDVFYNRVEADLSTQFVRNEVLDLSAEEHYYHFVDATLEVGRRFRFNFLDVVASVGAARNLYLIADRYNTSSGFVETQTITIPETSNEWMLTGQVGVEKNIAPRFNLGISVRATSGRTIHVPQTTYEQSLVPIQVGFGVRYEL